MTEQEFTALVDSFASACDSRAISCGRSEMDEREYQQARSRLLSAYREAAGQWDRLRDSDWVNIVNEEGVQKLLRDGDGDLAVAAAVKLTEARCKELNTRPSADARDAVVVALRNLIAINEQHNAEVEKIIGRPLGWKDDYLNEARAALEGRIVRLG